MVLDPLTRTLFIFAGQRDDKYLSDMYAYDITTNTVSELFSNFSASGGPDACFTQRAVVDPKLREVYVCVSCSFSVSFARLEADLVGVCIQVLWVDSGAAVVCVDGASVGCAELGVSVYEPGDRKSVV